MMKFLNKPLFFNIGDLIMKAKVLLTAVLLAATNFAWASGGLSIDSVEANDYISAENSQPEIVAQGPIDQFDVVAPGREDHLVDTNRLKKSYDGQS